MDNNFYDFVQEQQQNDPAFKQLTQITAGELSPEDESREHNSAHPTFGEPIFAIQAFERGFLFSTPQEELDKESIIQCLNAIYTQLTNDEE